MSLPGNGNHVVVKDGKFHALVSELRDGNFIVISMGTPVYATKDDAVKAAIAEPIPNEASEEWLHQ